jgi:hypothetical protein
MCTLPLPALKSDPIPTFPQVTPNGVAARKLREIKPLFRCPVIGMCLTPEEQRRILKKAGHAPKNMSAFDMHELLVAEAGSGNRLALRVEGLLNRKFGRKAIDLHRLTETQFMACWTRAFKSGDYLAELWAAASRRDLSEAAAKEIHGIIHMAMHANAHDAAELTRRLELFKRKTDEQARDIKTILSERRTLQKENELLKRRVNERESLKQAAVSARKPAEERTTTLLEEEKRRLQAVVDAQAAELECCNRKLLSMEKRILQLSQELEDQKRAEEHFRNEAREALHDFLEMNRCDSSCPSFDLCRKRVLIVGGISRMEGIYRRLIETNGGVFEYHDGYMHGGTKQLESRLKRSDIVLCPVNCNSHAACALVKNLGKKHNKPVHMLPNFSLNAISQVIRTCGAGLAGAN